MGATCRLRITPWLVLIGAWIAFGAPAAAQETAGSEDSPAGDEGVSQISVSLDTVTLLSGEKGVIEVLQLIRVVNSDDRPFLGEPATNGMARTVFRLPFPEGAFEIAPSDRSNPHAMSEGPAGIVTTAPLPPGESLISYIYKVRPARTGWALRRPIEYPTGKIDLLLGPELEMDSAPGFALAERKRLGRVEYKRFRGGPFTPGSVLTADVSFGRQSTSDLWFAFASAAAAVAIIGLGVSLLVRRRRRANHPPGDPEDLSPPADRENLVLRIAELDEEFDAGSLAEGTYRTKRRALKDKLAKLSEEARR